MEEKIPLQLGAHDAFAHIQIKSIILGFFTALGAAFFFTCLFFSLYLAFFQKPPVMELIIADGRKLYDEMQEIEKEKAKEKEDTQKTADADVAESQFINKIRKRFVDLH